VRPAHARADSATNADSPDPSGGARTPLRLDVLDRHHFLTAVTDYESSGQEAHALALDRLSAFNPAHLTATANAEPFPST
jgi:hypothetical protein